MGRWSDLARKFEVGRMSPPDNRQKPAERNEDHVSTAITSFDRNRQEPAKSPTDDTVADFLPVSTSKKGTPENPTDNGETTFFTGFCRLSGKEINW